MQIGLSNPSAKKARRIEKMIHYVKQNKSIYLLALAPFIFFLLFAYKPMYGIIIAFKDYKYNLGIIGSPFVGFEHFQRMFEMQKFYQVLGNTLKISFLRLVVEFPFPILLALMLNEVTSVKLKKFFQTVYTFPNFISWIVISGIIFTFFNSDGIVNGILSQLGLPAQNIMTNSNQFLFLIIFSNVWKGAGWGAIIYLSSLASIDPTFYEAAVVDGANRFQKLWYITLPCLVPTIVVLLILNMGNVMNAGFDQIFNLYNPVVMDKVDILDTYVYRATFEEGGNFSFSAAVGLFKSVINMILLVSVNKLAHLMGQRGIY